MFNRAVGWRLLPTNPLFQVACLPEKDCVSSDGIQFLSKAESETVLEWLRVNDPWLYPKVVVLLHSGIRYGEMVALRMEDARLSAASPHLSICRSRCRHSGQFLIPKGKRARMIPLAQGLAAFLSGLVQGRHFDEPLLWKSWEECRWPTKFEDHFRKANRESKVTRVKIHDLRHTFAVRFLENGGNIFDLKEILGHRDIKLTMRYSHFSVEMAERARGVVDFERPKLTVLDGGVR